MSENIKDLYISHVRESVNRASENMSKLTNASGVLNIEGMSSNKVRHFLNNICSFPDSRYLEVGTYKGSTLMSALYGNLNVIATAIDNFSEFGGPRAQFMSTVEKYSKTKEIPLSLQFIDSECFSVDCSSIEKKNIYFYDGGHTEEDHTRAFTYFNNVLDKNFICIIDDWNWEGVKTGTKKAFISLGYNVSYEVVLPARFNADREFWWNGLYVAVVTKP